MDTKEMLFMFFGGLGIFLFGIKSMSEGLQKTAGDRLRNILEKMTSNPIMAVIAGTLVTAIIQSSSGTTVLTVGLVNAGLLPLRSAIGIIMGANIGTTITSFIIGFKISKYALPIIAVGAMLIFFSKNKKVNYWGQVLFGFGMLFLGLEFMSDGMKPLRSSEVFVHFMETLAEYPVLGVLVGSVFTVIVQSSSATIGVLQGLAESGGVTFNQALPILFGDNIGTTVTAALAAIGTSVAARRAALTHVMFNVIGTFIFLPLLSLGVFPALVQWIAGGFDIKMQIAWAHGIFNVSNTLIQLPFIALLASLVTKIIPGQEATLEFGPKFLDKRFLSNPSVAIGQASNELLRMGGLAKQSLTDGIEFFFTGDENKGNESLQIEEVVNDLDRKITDYLVNLTQSSLSKIESNRATLLLQTINDIERVGDHAENIVELAQYSHDHKLIFSEQAQNELKEMMELTTSTYQMALDSLDKSDHELAKKVLENETKIDETEKGLRKSHLSRLNNGACVGSSGVIFLDIISNLERIGDHSVNIAEAVLEDL